MVTKSNFQVIKVRSELVKLLDEYKPNPHASYSDALFAVFAKGGKKN